MLERRASTSSLAHLNDWAVPVLGSLFAQELVSRTSASRSARIAKRSALVAAGVYLVVGSIPVLLGAIAHHTLPGADSEQVLAVLAQKHLPRFGYMIFAGALVSAILSTVDSALLVCGSLVSHNLATLVLHGLERAPKVMLARASVVVLSAVAYGLARSADSVHALVEQASAFGSAGVCVAGSLGLFTRHGGKLAAYACTARWERASGSTPPTCAKASRVSAVARPRPWAATCPWRASNGLANSCLKPPRADRSPARSPTFWDHHISAHQQLRACLPRTTASCPRRRGPRTEMPSPR